MTQPTGLKISASAGLFGSTGDRLWKLLCLGSLPSRLLLRTKTGLEVIHPLSVCSVTALLLLISWVANLRLLSFLGLGNGVPDSSLFYFAWALSIAGLLQFFRRWREEKRGVKMHTLDPGTGYFHFLPLPRWVLDCAVDPALAFVLSMFCRNVLGWELMGLTLMLSSVAFFIVECHVHREFKQRGRKLRNAGIEGEAAAGQMRVKESPKNPDAGGIIAPLPDDDLEAQIERNKRELMPGLYEQGGTLQ